MGSLQDQDSKFLIFRSQIGAKISVIRGTINSAVPALVKAQLGEEFINPVKLS